jgi:O-acetyl-ADP-ribose deacetylase (regulator of RNase III)
LAVSEVHIPRIGCGLGGLDWDLEVESVLLEVEGSLARTHPVIFVVCDV